jgi:hypothetical protein
MSINKKKLLLDKSAQNMADKLQNVLQKQIKLAAQGNISGVEALVGQAGLLIERINDLGVLEISEFKNYQKKLQKLYKELCLALAAQKAEVEKELIKVRKGRRAIKAYRGSI